MKLDTNEFFHCYSPRVLDHLLKNGFELYKDPNGIIINPFVHIYKHKTCYIFKRTPELDKCRAEISKCSFVYDDYADIRR